MELTGVVPLLILVVGTIVRCFVPVEIPSYTRVINVEGPFSKIHLALIQPLGSSELEGHHVILLLWGLGALFFFSRSMWRYWRFSVRLSNRLPLEDGHEILKIAECTANRLHKREYVAALNKVLAQSAQGDTQKPKDYLITELCASEELLLQRENLFLEPAAKRKQYRFLSVLVLIAMVAALLFSYPFVFQSHFSPLTEEITAGGYMEITPDNTYLIPEANGNYTVYIDGERDGTVNTESAKIMLQSGFELKSNPE